MTVCTIHPAPPTTEQNHLSTSRRLSTGHRPTVNFHFVKISAALFSIAPRISSVNSAPRFVAISATRSSAACNAAFFGFPSVLAAFISREPVVIAIAKNCLGAVLLPVTAIALGPFPTTTGTPPPPAEEEISPHPVQERHRRSQLSARRTGRSTNPSGPSVWTIP
jgi:hypothetical protein